MKVVQRVKEMWSGHESVTDGQNDELTDEGHSYIYFLPLCGGGLKPGR